MRSHCAVYVDVGYLLASAATRVTGTSLRSGVEVDHAQLIEAIMTQAVESSGLPVLRVNWYDSGGGRGGTPDRLQEQIGLLPRVKLRLGRLSHAGEQKGVDLKIGLDLVTHARNNAVDVMFLVSGDDDLTEAVEEAQAHGIEVVLMAVQIVGGKPHAVSKHLLRAADRLELLEEKAIDASITLYVREMFHPPLTSVPGAGEQEPLEEPAGSEGSDGPDGPDGEAHHEQVRHRQRRRVSHDIAAEAPDGVPAVEAVEGETAPATEGPVEPVEIRSEPPAAADGEQVDGVTKALPPTPAMMPRKLPGAVVPPRPSPVAPVLVHQSVTGRAAGGWYDTIDPAEEERLVDQVCAAVLDMWVKRASDEEVSGLLDNEPQIPGDIDRALLIDLSTRLNSYALDEPMRHILRSRFWHIARARLGA